ncbi:elongation factor Ts [Streptococcus pyogenes]|nr:elongation factor Ts [Streptococcus pyogenes]
MAEITAKLVKELREKSGAGVMDAKKHLLKQMVTWTKPLNFFVKKEWLKQLKS